MKALEEFKIARTPLHLNVEDSAEYEVGKKYQYIDRPIFFIVKEILSEVDLAVFNIDGIIH